MAWWEYSGAAEQRATQSQRYQQQQAQVMARWRKEWEDQQKQKDNNALTGFLGKPLKKGASIFGDAAEDLITPAMKGLDWYDREVVGRSWNNVVGPSMAFAMNKDFDDGWQYENLDGWAKFGAGAIADPMNLLPVGSLAARGIQVGAKGARMATLARSAGGISRGLSLADKAAALPITLPAKGIQMGARGATKMPGLQTFGKEFFGNLGRETTHHLSTRAAERFMSYSGVALKEAIPGADVSRLSGEDAFNVFNDIWKRGSAGTVLTTAEKEVYRYMRGASGNTTKRVWEQFRRTATSKAQLTGTKWGSELQGVVDETVRAVSDGKLGESNALAVLAAHAGDDEMATKIILGNTAGLGKRYGSMQDWLRRRQEAPIALLDNLKRDGNVMEFLDSGAQAVAGAAKSEIDAGTAATRLWMGNWGDAANWFDPHYRRFWTNGMDRYVVRPFTEMILGFPFFAIGNVMEDLQMSALGGEPGQLLFGKTKWRMSAKEMRELTLGTGLDFQFPGSLFSDTDLTVALQGSHAAAGETGRQALSGLQKGAGGYLFGGRYLKTANNISADIRRSYYMKRWQRHMLEAGADAVMGFKSPARAGLPTALGERLDKVLLLNAGNPSATIDSIMTQVTGENVDAEGIRQLVTSAGLPDGQGKQFLLSNAEALADPASRQKIAKQAYDMVMRDTSSNIERVTPQAVSFVEDVIQGLDEVNDPDALLAFYAAFEDAHAVVGRYFTAYRTAANSVSGKQGDAAARAFASQYLKTADDLQARLAKAQEEGIPKILSKLGTDNALTDKGKLDIKALAGLHTRRRKMLTTRAKELSAARGKHGFGTPEAAAAEAEIYEKWGQKLDGLDREIWTVYSGQQKWFKQAQTKFPEGAVIEGGGHEADDLERKMPGMRDPEVDALQKRKPTGPDEAEEWAMGRTRKVSKAAQEGYNASRDELRAVGKGYEIDQKTALKIKDTQEKFQEAIGKAAGVRAGRNQRAVVRLHIAKAWTPGSDQFLKEQLDQIVRSSGYLGNVDVVVTGEGAVADTARRYLAKRKVNVVQHEGVSDVALQLVSRMDAALSHKDLSAARSFRIYDSQTKAARRVKEFEAPQGRAIQVPKGADKEQGWVQTAGADADSGVDSKVLGDALAMHEATPRVGPQPVTPHGPRNYTRDVNYNVGRAGRDNSRVVQNLSSDPLLDLEPRGGDAMTGAGASLVTAGKIEDERTRNQARDIVEEFVSSLEESETSPVHRKLLEVIRDGSDEDLDLVEDALLDFAFAEYETRNVVVPPLRVQTRPGMFPDVRPGMRDKGLGAEVHGGTVLEPVMPSRDELMNELRNRLRSPQYRNQVMAWAEKPGHVASGLGDLPSDLAPRGERPADWNKLTTVADTMPHERGRPSGNQPGRALGFGDTPGPVNNPKVAQRKLEDMTTPLRLSGKDGEWEERFPREYFNQTPDIPFGTGQPSHTTIAWDPSQGDEAMQIARDIYERTGKAPTLEEIAAALPPSPGTQELPRASRGGVPKIPRYKGTGQVRGPRQLPGFEDAGGAMPGPLPFNYPAAERVSEWETPDLLSGLGFNPNLAKAIVAVADEQEARQLAARANISLEEARKTLLDERNMDKLINSNEFGAQLTDWRSIFSNVKSREARTFGDLYKEPHDALVQLMKTVDAFDQYKGVSPEVQQSLTQVVNDYMGQREQLGFESLRSMAKQASERATEDYHRWYTNYDDGRAVHSLMRHVFPFWRYEAQRWTRMKSVATRHPWYITNFHRYITSSDDGKIALPHTPFKFNPMAGGLFNTFSRLMADGGWTNPVDGREKPFEAVKELAEQAGFIPGMGYSLPASFAEGRLGNEIPTSVDIMLSGMSGYGPPGMRGVAENIKEILPSSFDRYNADMQMVKQGIHPYEATEEQETDAKRAAARDEFWGQSTGQMFTTKQNPREEIYKYQARIAARLGIPQDAIDHALRYDQSPLYVRNEAGKRYLDDDTLAQIEKRFPEWEGLQATSSSFQSEGERATAKQRYASFQKRDEYEKLLEEELQPSYEAFAQGQIDGEEWRNRRSQAMAKERGARELLDQIYPKTGSTKDLLSQSGKQRKDVLRQLYREMEPEMTPDGGLDWDGLEKKRAQFLNMMGATPDEIRYITSTKDRFTNDFMNQMEAEYSTAQSHMDEYSALPRWDGMPEWQAQMAQSGLELIDRIRKNGTNVTTAQALAILARREPALAAAARKALTVQRTSRGKITSRDSYKAQHPLLAKYYGM